MAANTKNIIFLSMVEIGSVVSEKFFFNFIPPFFYFQLGGHLGWKSQI
jgi:hypothetical protein